MAPMPFMEAETEAPRADFVCPRSHRSGGAELELAVQPVGLHGPHASCHHVGLWAGSWKGWKPKFSSVRFHDANFWGSTHKWHKNSIWWIRAHGNQVLLGSSVICWISQDKTCRSYLICCRHYAFPWGWQAAELSTRARVRRVQILNSNHPDSTIPQLRL